MRHCEAALSPRQSIEFIRRFRICLHIIFQCHSGKRGRVYLAGPFFSLAQVWLNNEIMRSLTELGLDVWSPMVEAGILTPRSSLKRVKEVVAKDLRALDDATMVFAVLDGLDAGTLFEIGYAVKRGIPVVGLAQQPTVGDLTMLHGADCQIFEDIATALYHAAWIAHRL